MISLLLALATQAAPDAAEARLRACVASVQAAPAAALATATAWQAEGGGLYARQCLGQAYAALERWAPAATAFEQAAIEADTLADEGRADFHVQAGNAWLAAGDPLKARRAFDAALATALLTPGLRGEVHFDRARAGAAVGDAAGARADIDKGLALTPQDPFGWYLSSALALREEKLARAQSDIARAMALAPDDADILLQAGTVAGLSGEVEAAQAFYERAARRAPDSPSGKAAAAALAANGGAKE